MRSFETFAEGSTDILCALAFSVIIILSFSEDQRNGLKCLIYGCSGGRKKLFVKRTLILLFSVGIGSLLVLLLRLFSCILTYGSLPPLNTAVQCSEMFRACVYPITVWEYIAVRYLALVLCSLVFGLICWLALILCRSFRAAVFFSLLFFLLQKLLYDSLSLSSMFGTFKYLNLFALYHLPELFIVYQNTNVAGFPVSCWLVTVVFSLVVALLALIAAGFAAVHQRPIRSPDIFTAISDRIQKIAGTVRSRFTLFLHEIRKSLVFQHGWAIAVLFAVAVISVFQTPPADMEMFDADLSVTERRFVGEANEDTLARMDAREQEIKKWQDRSSRNTARKELNRVRESVLNKIDQNKGLWVVNEATYATLFNRSKYQSRIGYACMAVIVLLCSVLFPYERQCSMTPLLFTAGKGRKKAALRKIRLALTYSCLIMLFTASREIILTEKFYGDLLGTLSAPIQSMAYFAEYPLAIPMWLAILLFYLAKLLILCVTALTACLLSCRIKSPNLSAACCFAVLLLPGILQYFGVIFMANLSLSSLFSPLSVSPWVYPAALAVCAAETVVICRLSGANAC